MLNFNFNNNILSGAHISFSRSPNNQNSFNFNFGNTAKTLNLVDDSFNFNILKLIPRLFTIITNNGSCQFNVELLKDTSSVIASFLEKNPNALQYHIDVNDEGNIFSKFEKMYQGEKVIFDEDELPICKKITSALNILYCPNYMKPESLRTSELITDSGSGLASGVGISKCTINQFIKSDKFKEFRIDTNNKSYICNYFGVYASEVIRELILKDPTLRYYKYDFDDDSSDFQIICNLFNFGAISITPNNMHLLEEIAEDLQISDILPKIKKNINEYENVAKAIDEQQATIDSIEEVFEWLYNIQDLSIDSVKNSIIQSIWSKSEDNIHELAAFIIQVIKTSIPHHRYLIDLLIQLNKEANESNDINLLIPFIVKQLMLTFGESLQNCSFVYILYKNGFISKEEIFNKLSNICKYFIQSTYNAVNNRNTISTISISVWFLSEIIEMNLYDEFITNTYKTQSLPPDPLQNRSQQLSFIKLYYPDKIDLYKKMRDNFEPDDELTKALRIDDVDKVQSILVSIEDFSSVMIPYNIYESFINNGQTKLIDYAAAYGSVKCFKYLKLNHLDMNDYTFTCALYGGNIEIIKIVDQQLQSQSQPTTTAKTIAQGLNKFTFNFSLSNTSSINSDINPAIIKHQNKLFDWILEQKYSNQSVIEVNSSKLLTSAVENGNAHVFIEILDKVATSCNIQDYIQIAAKNGFYRLTQLILNFMSKRSDEFKNQIFSLGSGLSAYVKMEDFGNGEFMLFNSSYVYFGNLSIFKIGLKMNKNQDELEKSLAYCIDKDYMSIFKYFFDVVVKDGFKITRSGALKALKMALKSQISYYLSFLIEQYIQINPKIFKGFTEFGKLLENACSSRNLEYVKIIMNIIIEYKIINDFTNAFIVAVFSQSKDICQYFIDQKVFINYNLFMSKNNEIGSINEDIFSLIYENAFPEIKEKFLCSTLYSAINNKNVNLIEWLYNKNVPDNDALIKAVSANDIDIVNVVLKHNSKPEFINKKSQNGSTPLFIATSNNNIQIVKRLLEVPGIDPSLYGISEQTPLILSIVNFNVEIMNIFLDFYGENISSQTWQLEQSIKTTLKMLSNDDTSQNPIVMMNAQSCILDINERKSKLLIILKKILEIKEFNPDIRGGEHTLLSYACAANEISIINMLLQTDKVDVNAYAPSNGNTPLMIAIQLKNTEIAELLIKDKRTNINLKNYLGETALTIATSNNLDQIVSLLINNEKFDPEESRISYAFYLSTGKIAKQLISVKSVDINYKYVIIVNSSPNYESPLTSAIRKNDIEKIDLIIQCPTFDKFKSRIIAAIFIATSLEDTSIFKKLLTLIDNDVNILSANYQTLFFWVVHENLIDYVTLILSYDTFDSKKSDILGAFLFSFRCDLSITKKIYEYDQEHDHLIDLTKLLPSGKSFLTSITLCNDDLIDFLIKNGANPNEPDLFGIYPLEYAILTENGVLASALINSDKIDYSARLSVDDLNNFADLKNNSLRCSSSKSKYKTYLHVAALSSNTKMLKILLDNKCIDVNITDDEGETPLMDAARSLNFENIRLLFEQQELDYLHCNNDGKDALKIMNYNGEVKNRDEYMQRLMNPNVSKGFVFSNKTNTTNSNDSSKPVLSLGQPNSTASKGFTFSNQTNTTNSNDSSKPALSLGQSILTKSPGVQDINLPNQTNTTNSNDSSKSASSFGQTNSAASKGLTGFNLPNQTNTANSNNSYNPALSFGQTNSTTNKGFSGFNLPNQTNTTNSNDSSKPASSFGQTNSAASKGLTGFNLPNQTNTTNSNDSSKPAFSFGQSILTTSKVDTEANLSNEKSSFKSAFSIVQNKATNPSSLSVTEKDVNSENESDEQLSHPKVKPTNDHVNKILPLSSFEKEVESAISGILHDVSPNDIMLISKSLSAVAEKKVKKMMSHIHDINENDYLDDDHFSPPDQSFVNYNNNYSNIMAQQQWKQYMQMTYASQAQFNIQMQQIQMMGLTSFNQKPLKKRKKSKSKSKK